MASSSMAKPNGTLNYFPSHVQDFPMIASVSITPRFSEVCPSSLNSTFNRTANASRLPIIRAHVSPDYVPDAKFYKVEAILRPWRIPQVSAALLKMGIRGVTVSDVRGFGAQGGLTERQAGSEFSEDKFVAKVKMEIVVSKDRVIGAKKCFWNFSSCFTFDWWLKKTAVIHVVYKNFLLGSKKFLQVVHNLVLP
ncbi:nitrogen regulatory P-II homolog [Olea europaea subsp. europaea]|uniref:Nitrogen regulatory P-II homolog n=1 Tax=Olea europaea subsp. europaea TaxID=158383 RepID=A0A8S0T4P2_OLEEU|nr:nitrogen regulatory P-II homolog [Olea europaea subsp. europaea]